MHRGQRAWVVPLVLALFIAAVGTAGSGLGNSELPSIQAVGSYAQDSEYAFTGDKGVHRDCVLLEIFMRPT
jgi:hypothetical protein